MVDRLKKELISRNIYGWEITDTATEGWEYYFIRHDLDQNRYRAVRDISVKVYVQTAEDMIGSASASLPPTMTQDEIPAEIDKLIYQASLVKNRIYDLTPPRKAEPVETGKPDLALEAEKFIRAFASQKEDEVSKLNSYEIFAQYTTKRLLTSTGIDLTQSYPSSLLDVVVNAKEGGHEVELYRLYPSGQCDESYMDKEIGGLLRFAKDRLHTSPTPALKDVPVLFTTDAALDIYRYFLANLSTAYVYRKMSPFEIGKAICEDIGGDTLAIEALRTLPNSSANFAYDEEGAPVTDRVLMESSVPKAYWGGRMYSRYLGLDDTFQITNWRVRGGKKDEKQLRSTPYLEVVEFSDFQVDEMTGDIFGEIRLAYYFDGEKTAILSGGSVSGSMLDNLGSIEMSREERQYNNALIPSATKLYHVNITGVKGE